MTYYLSAYQWDYDQHEVVFERYDDKEKVAARIKELLEMESTYSSTGKLFAEADIHVVEGNEIAWHAKKEIIKEIVI